MEIEHLKPGVHGSSLVQTDERDLDIIRVRMEQLNIVKGPRCGDWVDFDNGNGKRQRISHLWGDGSEPEWDGAQTSDGGSFYLGEGYVSFSGGLDLKVPFELLTLTDQTRMGSAWIFHHNWHTAHNGIDFKVPFRVYHCPRLYPNCSCLPGVRCQFHPLP